MLTGEYYISSDEKGRIMFPSKIREELSGESLYITKSVGVNCLQILKAEYFEELCGKLFGKGSFSINPKAQLLQRYIIAPAVNFTMCDKNERFLIPQSLRIFAGIKPKSELVMLAVIDRLEIWEAEEYKKYNETCMPSISDAAEEISRILECK